MNHWNLSDERPLMVSTETLAVPEDFYFKATGLYVLFCLQGEAEIEINLRKYTICPNTQLVLLPGFIVQVNQVTDQFGLVCMGFCQSIFTEVSNCLEPAFFHFIKERPMVVLPDDEAALLRHTISLVSTINQDTGNRYRRQMAGNYCQNLLFHFYNRTQQHFQQNGIKWVSRKEELFKNFLQLVHQNCAVHREVNFYARKLSITPRYLSNIVQEMSHETTKEIIDRHAIMEIKVMLKNSHLNIQEISNRMKFTDQSFFGRYFKKHTGMSPLQYRNYE